jgi:hypothetical protein
MAREKRSILTEVICAAKKWPDIGSQENCPIILQKMAEIAAITLAPESNRRQ